jgi:MFS family permease
MSLSAFVDVALFYPAGVIMDKFGRKYAIVPRFTLQALGLLIIPFATGFAGLLLAATITGMGNGLSSGTMMTLGSDLAPKESLGEFLGLWRLIGDGGFTGGPVIVGAIADVLALGPAAIVMAVIGLASAGLFAFGVPETHPRVKLTQK